MTIKRHKPKDESAEGRPFWLLSDYERMDTKFCAAVLRAIDCGAETCKYTTSGR